MTSSCHRCLGLPTGLVPTGFQSNSFLVGLAWSILCIWPSHLILCALMNLTISAPSINLSISILFRILHILSILTGPNISLGICLSKCVDFFIFCCKVKVSDQYITNGPIIVLLPAFIFISIFFAVLLFWRLVAGLSPLRAEFDPKKVHEKCVVYKVAQGQVSVCAC